MEKTRYIMQGDSFWKEPVEIVTKEKPNTGDIRLFSTLYKAKKIKIYEAKLEFLKEIGTDETEEK